MRILLWPLALALCVCAASASAEVRESEFGKDEGYPFEMGWPFRTIPKLRHGALTGQGLPQLEKSAPAFWLPPASQPVSLPRAEAAPSLASDATQLMGRNPIMAMLLVKDGALVFERYQYATSPDTLFDSQSIAKTFTALTLGTLVDEGLLKGISQRMDELVPGLKGSPIGAATVRQTLQMQCGHQFKWEDAGPDASAGRYAGVRFAARNGGRSQNLYSYFQTLPPAQPGTKFSYDPHCTDALSMLVTQLTGKSLRQNFDARIWQRLGPQSRAAWLSPSQHPELTSGASAFYATARDYARLAFLYIGEGKSNGQQIVSTQWMRQMHTDVVEVGDYPSNFKRYGYQTWVRDRTTDSWFAGLGNFGQRFYIDARRKNAMVLFALDDSHIRASDLFWDRFNR